MKKEKFEKVEPVLKLIKIGAAVILVIMGLLDFTGIMDMGAYHGSLALIACGAVLLAVSAFILQKRESRTVRFFRKMVIASVILELTLFQIPSYNMMMGDYEKASFYPVDSEISGGESTSDTNMKSVTVKGQGQVVFDFKDLDMTVGSIMADVKFSEGTKRVQLKVDMADETHIEPRTDAAGNVIVDKADGSEYMACQFSGKVSELKLKFSCFNDGDSVTIKKIYLNETVPFDISAIRFGFLTFLVTFCYGIVVSGFLRKPYRQTRKFTVGSILALTAAAVVMGTAFIMIKLPNEGDFTSRWKLEYGDQITQEIVDAFENKQVNLLKEPTEELLALENPYDWSARNLASAGYEWDHVYYDGEYYSYYGIAPVLTVFLPYHKLTGHYFANDMAVWIFSCIGLIFLGLTYLAITKRWFKSLPSGCIIAGYIVLLSACGIWFSLGRPSFYEIAVSSGFMYLTMGAYFLISANILSKGKISLIRTILCSLFLGLAVLSRPTLAVYAICAAVFLVMSFKKSSEKIGGRIAFLLSAAVPICALGAFQMWYNYARFDSPFDFGIKYSLTINDFVHCQFHLIFMLVVIYNFIFAAPGFTSDYPFVKTQFSRMGANGYLFADAGNTSGILYLALPVFGYLLSGNALRRLPDRRTKLRYAAMIGLPCVVMPFVIICSVWQSGYAVRYLADFSWEIVIGALLVLFWLYRKSRNVLKKKLFRCFMAVSVVAATLINFVQIIPFAFYENDYPEICRAMQDIIAFWN